MFGVQQNLSIYDVELDRNNPRIRRFVEGFEGELTDDNIQLALDIGSDEGDSNSKGMTTADKLRNSILANSGIMQPIIVCRNDSGKYLCIEGNTRLFIYRRFHEDGVTGNWSTIPAIVHEALDGDGIDAIRLQAHLVGPRPWDAYSKAKYQWELHYSIGADLREASLSQLARAITEKAEKIPLSEILRLRQNPDDDAVRYLLDALDALQNLTIEVQQRRDDVG
ncbi:MAG TPA: ParB N-terminal domain-containing protein [Mesorhizobium sp.]|uniref:ParB N-terminal domain-containing protein n=1 Tax=Mesorhizobium sp. TaxID=1871066 RepID=UPI002DDD7DD9|nr:ParB N-terminal domain-containing protein [Mesorhizobium sp.]HEV2501853.1 ParB N-terminal domain-containing protein [Mesorhizobium sp.]